MFKLWQISTGVFVLQLVVAALTYLIVGDATLALLAAFAAALMVTLFAGCLLVIGKSGVSAAATFIGLAAIVFTLDAMFSTPWGHGLPGLFMTALVSAPAAFLIGDGNNPYWKLFIISLPGGIGAVFGGVNLWWEKHSQKGHADKIPSHSRL